MKRELIQSFVKNAHKYDGNLEKYEDSIEERIQSFVKNAHKYDGNLENCSNNARIWKPI